MVRSYGSYYYVYDDYGGRWGFGTRMRDRLWSRAEDDGRLSTDAAEGSVTKNVEKFGYLEGYATEKRKISASHTRTELYTRALARLGCSWSLTILKCVSCPQNTDKGYLSSAMSIDMPILHRTL